MPNINVPSRAWAVVFLAGAIAVLLWFPDNSFTPDVVRALFWWFAALGIVRWLEEGILRASENAQDRIDITWWKIVVISSLVAQIVLFAIGISYFFRVMSKL